MKFLVDTNIFLEILLAQERKKESGEVKLDFDDALQYFVAKRLGVPLVSFDLDFDRTDIERLTPREVLSRYS